MNMQKEIGNNITHDKIREFLWKTLKSGQVVPGYVHSVLLCVIPYIDDRSIVLCMKLWPWRAEKAGSPLHGTSAILREPTGFARRRRHPAR